MAVRKKTKHFNVRMSTFEKEEYIEKNAEKLNLNGSDYLRLLLLQNEIDEETLKKIKLVRIKNDFPTTETIVQVRISEEARQLVHERAVNLGFGERGDSLFARAMIRVANLKI